MANTVSSSVGMKRSPISSATGLVRLDRAAETQLHGLAEVAQILHDQRPVEAHLGAHRGDVLC